jgi:uncharacterized caspase-like protein
VADRRLALIIGTSHYANAGLQQLRSPSTDAQALADVLADPKIGRFEVTLLLDKTADTLRRAIERFCRTAARDDLAVIHVACHGIKDDDASNLYFAATDTDLDLLESTGVAAAFVNGQLARSRCRNKVLFLDCCFSGAFLAGLRPFAADTVDLKQKFDGHGQIVITASSSFEYSFEGEFIKGDGVKSAFTSAIVGGLKDGSADEDGDGWVSVNELYQHVEQAVAATTRSQTPRKWEFEVQGSSILIAQSPNGPRPGRRERGTGQLHEAPEPSDGVYSPTAARLRTLPPAVDMRSLCPEVYDQGNIGSSVAQAIAAGLEFSRRRQGLEAFTPSRLFIYYIAREADGYEQMDSGASYRTALQAVNRYGFPPESEWPYITAKFTQRPSRNAYRAAARHSAIAYKRVRGRVDHLKACLTEGFPVLLGFPVYNSIWAPEVAETGRVPVPAADDQWAGGHAVMIVGYDDAEQVFIVQNSWGKSWGQDGFFFLPYAYVSANTKSEDFWTVRSVW